MVDNKDCVACGENKPASKFYKDKRMKSGLSSECKTCVRARNKEYLKTYKRKGPDGKELDAEGLRIRARGYHLVRRYGITYEEYDVLVEKADGKCQICGNKTEKLHVDHCHETGMVRGLLCINCNHGLGKFFDSIQNLENAISFLKKFSGQISDKS